MSNPIQYRVLICTKQGDPYNTQGGCFHCGGVAIYQAFLAEINRQQLEGNVEIRQSGCLDHCELGAVALVAPVKRHEPSWLPTKIQKRMLSNQHWYGRLQIADIPEIVESHLINGRPLERQSFYV
jgi:(2Fe-2S) ferredoxin